MPKPIIYNFDNGATLIYQKQKEFDGADFSIGFRGGAQLDGKYTGLSHLLEHLLFRSPKEDLGKNILDNILKYTIDQNAQTSEDYITVEFSAAKKHIDVAVKNCMDMICNKKFTPEQIAREISVVKQEINIYKDKAAHTPASAYSTFMQALTPEEEFGGDPSIDPVLGSPKTLAKITPEILTKYVKRYFNTNNLIVSVTSNMSDTEVIKLVQEKILPRLSPAKDPAFIVGYPPEPVYNDMNILVAQPQPNFSTATVRLLLKEREYKPEDPHKEYACDVMEEYLMNTIGGVLWDKLRVKKQLVYSYKLGSMYVGNRKYKCFNATTNEQHLNQTIKELCKVIKTLGEKGIPEEDFKKVKSALISQKAAELQRYTDCSANSNFLDYLYGDEFIDYNLVSKNIANMTYEEFNHNVTQVYKNANASILIDGGFESHNVPSIIDIENMLGKHTNDADRFKLNVPRIEATPTTPPVVAEAEQPEINNKDAEVKDIDDEVIMIK